MIASYRWESNIGEHFVRLDQIAGIDGAPRIIIVYLKDGGEMHAKYVGGQEPICEKDKNELMAAWDTWLSRSLE